MAEIGSMAQSQASAAWRLFSFNWLPIGLMATALAFGLALTRFSIKPSAALILFGLAGLLTGVAYYTAHASHSREPFIAFVLGSIAQLVLIILLMTPLTYIAAAADLPMRDGSLAYLDQALGLDWRAYFSFVYQRPALIAAVILGYGVIALPVIGIPVVLGMTRNYRRMQEFTLAFALALIVTTCISMVVPAIGTYDQLGIRPDPSVFTPTAYLDQLRDMPLVRDGALRELDLPKLTGIITFPSFHAATAILFLWALWCVWWLRPFALIANGAMLLATPMAGGHYFIDVFAGMAVALLAIVAALRTSKGLMGAETRISAVPERFASPDASEIANWASLPAPPK
jgi:hypothetical protein